MTKTIKTTENYNILASFVKLRSMIEKGADKSDDKNYNQHQDYNMEFTKFQNLHDQLVRIKLHGDIKERKSYFIEWKTEFNDQATKDFFRSAVECILLSDTPGLALYKFNEAKKKKSVDENVITALNNIKENKEAQETKKEDEIINGHKTSEGEQNNNQEPKTKNTTINDNNDKNPSNSTLLSAQTTTTLTTTAATNPTTTTNTTTNPTTTTTTNPTTNTTTNTATTATILGKLREESQNLLNNIKNFDTNHQIKINAFQSSREQLENDKKIAIEQINQIQKILDNNSTEIADLNTKINDGENLISQLKNDKETKDTEYKEADIKKKELLSKETVAAPFGTLTGKANASNNMKLNAVDSDLKNTVEQSYNDATDALNDATALLSEKENEEKSLKSTLNQRKGEQKELYAQIQSEQNQLDKIKEAINNNANLSTDEQKSKEYKALLSDKFQTEVKIFENLNSVLESTINNESHKTYKEALQGGYLKALSFRLFEITKKIANSSNVTIEEETLQDHIISKVALEKNLELTGFRIYQIIQEVSKYSGIDEKKAEEMYCKSIEHDYDDQSFYDDYVFSVSNQ